MSRSEARKNSIWSLWVAQKHRNLLFPYLCRWQKRLFSLFYAYVVDRNIYFLFFALMSLAETIIFSFSCLCLWQKRLFSLFRAYVVDRSDYFSPFALSETFRSMKILHLLFLKRSEARKSSICSFWNVQKHKNLLFALSEMFRSMKNLYLLFLKRSEAWKSAICSFWNVQKHKNPLFGLSETFRSIKTRKLFARLPYNLYFCMQMKIYLT